MRQDKRPKRSKKPGTKKHVQKKRGIKSTPSIKSYLVRSEPNRIHLELPPGPHTLEDIELMLLNFDWSPVTRKIRKHKIRGHWTPPKAFYLIFKLVKPKGVEQYWSQISPVDMVVNLTNVQDFTINNISDLFESWEGAHEVMQDDDDIEEGSPIEYLDKLDMRYLKEIIFHFLYIKDETGKK